MNKQRRDQEIVLDIRLQPKQRLLLDAVRAGVRHPFYGGAKGGGKSFASRNIMLAMLLENEKTSGLLIRREYTQIYRNHVLKMLQEHPQVKQWWNKTDGMLYLPNGSILTFGHCEHEHDIFNYQGIEYDYIGVEEATNFTELQWSILTGSNRSTKLGVRPVMWATGNPGGVGHIFCKRLWVDRQFARREKPESYVYIPALVYDNEALMEADPEYVEELENLPDPLLREAYLRGSWDIYPDQFFAGWDRSTVVCKPFIIPASWKLLAGLDYGEVSPTSCGIYALDYDGILYRIGGYYKAGLAGSQHARGIRDWFSKCVWTSGRLPVPVYADPSMWTKRRVSEDHPNAPVDEFYKVGLGLTPANNSRENGWAACRNLLAENRLRVFDTAENADFLRTIPALPRAKSNPEDVDTHAEDHCGDEWRYVAIHTYRPMVAPLKHVPSAWEGETILKELAEGARTKASRYEPRRAVA